MSFLFSFLNDAHERRVGEALRAALPDVAVYLSSEVLPEIREFERASTTAVCAVVGPVLASYLDRLQDAISQLGLPKLHVMGSSGGVFDIAEGLRMPAMAVESGPAAGVIAASLAGRQLRRPNLISFDMGGTTAKASVIANGEVSVTAEYEVGGSGHANRWMHGTGHPIRVPVIDLAEVSAGGGSIAWVDPGGALKVGPQSAGAAPGPACYGAGGTLPTVTDADVVLGYLDREALLGGALRIDLAAAERAIEQRDRAAAWPDGGGGGGTHHRGGQQQHGAGAAHRLGRAWPRSAGVQPDRVRRRRSGACGVAGGGVADPGGDRAAGARGVLRAGLVASDLKRDYSRTLYADLGSIDPARVAEVIAGMEREGREMLRAARVPTERQVLLRQADVRYRRQAYELTVPIADGAITARRWTSWQRRFMPGTNRPMGTPTAPSACNWSICG